MTIWLQISSGSDKPIYQQVIEQISEAIAKGELKIGDRLPAVRKLAAELVVNPNTIARAYSCLEQQGLVVTKTGSGTYIKDPKMRSLDAVDINILTERIDTMIARGINLGLKPEKLIEMFKDRLEKFIKD